MKKWKEAVIGGFVWIAVGFALIFFLRGDPTAPTILIGEGMGLITAAGYWIYRMEEKKPWSEGQTSIPVWPIILLVVIGIVVYASWRLSII